MNSNIHRRITMSTILMLFLTVSLLPGAMRSIPASAQTSGVGQISAAVPVNGSVVGQATGQKSGPVSPGVCDTAGPIEVESSGGTITPTAYGTLGVAFGQINSGVHTGVITIDVCGDTTETSIAALNASGSGSASYSTITISPAGGATRTITGIFASELVLFNGADNVTIDGLNSGGNALIISNTSTAATSGTSTVKFINGATNNTITRSSILGSATMPVANNGGNIFFSTDGTTANGNDNNTISINNIGPAGANLPTKGIYGNGSTTTTAIGNSGIVINNNNIFDYFGAAVTSAGVATGGGCNTWSITNNRFYQTATRTWTTGAQHSPIWLLNSSSTSGAQGFTVTGNTIGYASNTQTGTYTLTGSTGKFVGIFFTGITAGTVSTISSNTIASVSLSGVTSSGTSTSTPFSGIVVTNGFANTNSNTIGSQSATGSLTFATTTTTSTDVYGIFNFSTDQWTANSNNIGGITANNAGATGAFIFYGMRANTSTSVSFNASSNNIGGTIANSVQSNSTSTTAQMIGIASSNAICNFTSNAIRNMTAAGGTGTTGGASMIGILNTGTGVGALISQNTVHTLANTNTTAATTVAGLQYTGAATGSNIISRNLIHSLNVASAAGIVNGINVSGGTTTYQNNVIRLGIDSAGNSITTGAAFSGVSEPLGTDNFYFNSIYIGGTGITGTANTFAFNSTQTVNTRNYIDNIFVNARSNGAGTGKHYAIRVGGTTPNPTGLTSNFNVFFTPGTGGVLGLFNSIDQATLAAWQAATGQDNSSFYADPQFVDPTGATPDLHINPSVTTVVEANGTNIGSVTDDFDGQTRSTLTPVDIGADAGNFMGVDLTGPAISYTPLANTTSTSARTLTATITDASGVPTSGIALPVLYWRINAGAYTGSQGVFIGGNQYQFTFGAGVVTGDTVFYYIAAQDNAGNVSVSPAGGASGFTTNPPAASTPPTTPNSYMIVSSISGIKTICVSGCDYTTLTGAAGAFNAINTSVATGNIELQIAGDLTTGEDGTNGLNPLAEEPTGSNFTVKIYPTGAPRAVTGTFSSALIRLNGSDRVTIDGSIGGTGTDRSLTITNSNTGTSSAVLWMQTNGVDGATNNTVRNLNVVGNSNTTTLIGIGTGSSTVSITSNGTGNNNNTIQNNNISKTQYGIYTGGASTANKNIGTVITQNAINTAAPNNVATGGIHVRFESGIQITQNDIGNILKHDGTTGTTGTAFGIALGVIPSNTVTTFTGSDVTDTIVTRNKINGVIQLNSTGYSAFGIVVNTVTSGTTLVANNMISGVRAASTSSDFSAGIVAGGGTGSTTQIYFNSVSMTGSRVAAAFPSYGLAIGSGDPTIDVRDNIFYNTQTSSSTAKMYAIGTGSTTFANMTSDYNDFYVSGASAFVGQTGGLGTSGTDRTNLAAWQAATGKDANSIFADPLFTSTTDLHVQVGTPIEGVGIAIAGITVDFDGENRAGLTPTDIGADAGNFALATATPTLTATPSETSTATETSTAPSTSTSTATNTATETATSTETSTATETATATPTETSTSTATETNTAIPTNTSTATAIPTNTATNTAVPTSTSTSTNTAVPTNTSTNTAVPTSTSTNTAVPTSTSTATNTSVPTSTSSNTAVPTSTATNTAVPTSTSTSTNTAVPTNTSTNTAVPTSTNTTTNTAVPTSTSTNTTVPTSTSTSTSTHTATVTATPTPDCTLNPNYVVTQSVGATIVPANNYVPGSTCNGCTVTIALPFTYTLYDIPYTSVNAATTGNLQFTTNVATGANTCLPDLMLGDAILPYWDNLNTNINDNMGIFTSVSGVAPNRIFNIRWLSGFEANDARTEFEVRLYEGLPKFEFIYGQVTRQGFSATVGVQNAGGMRFTQWSCGAVGSILPGYRLVFDRTTCPTFGGGKPR